MATLFWFRTDLRLHDNPALCWAAARGPVVPVFILNEHDGTRPLGGASRWWLHHSLAALQQAGVPLLLARGNPADVMPQLLAHTGATAVAWSRAYEPAAQARDAALKTQLKNMGLDVHSANASLLHEPWAITNLSGTDFKVFTPFWKTCLTHPVPEPLPASAVKWQSHAGLSLTDLKLLPTNPNWAKGWEAIWQPGEAGAWARFEDFLQTGLPGYAEKRDRPDLPHVSKLSAAIHFGEISVRQMFHSVRALQAAKPELTKDGDKFLAELGWREFAHHLHHYAPNLATKNWKKTFDAYPWRDAQTEAAADLRAWQRGQTGYPLVDAGMRELWQTGFLHNRVRMVVASFLIKHLRLDWRLGEAWFWDCLVDADAASNAASWQWVAGSGADASPYFRIFNPFGQGEKFDPAGAYVRRWCPELALLPDEFIHRPWEAPALVLKAADVDLGRTYPHPIVQHEAARAAALAGYEAVKAAGAPTP